MAKARDAFGMVLRSLRRDLREGRHTAGTVLNVADLAAAYATSTTPVREALAHLAGEGLIEDDRGRGHAVASFGSGEAAAFYALRGLYVREALERVGSDYVSQTTLRAVAAAGIAETAAIDLFEAASQLFARLISDARDGALAFGFALADARLGRLRSGERHVLTDCENELRRLLAIYVSDPSGLIIACQDYHQRRLFAADLIQHAADRNASISK